MMAIYHNRTNPLLISVVVATLFTSSCNRLAEDEGQQGQLRAVDNLSGIRFTLNQCGPSQAQLGSREADVQQLLQKTRDPRTQVEASFIEGRDESLRSLAARTLVAVPKHILDSVFSDLLHTQVVISSELVDQHCHNTTSSMAQHFFSEGGQQQKPFSCWHKPHGERMRVYIRAEREAIEHSLVRTFAFLFMEYLVPELLKHGRDLQQDEAGRMFVAALEHLQTEKQNLAQTFLREISSKPQHRQWHKLRELQQSDPEGFANMVYAETVDSHHCEGDTFNRFKKDFPQTWSVYQAEKQPGISLYNGFGSAWHEL